MKKIIAILLVAMLALCTAAFAEAADNDALLLGNWETADGMVVMTIEKNPGGEDWDVELTAAGSHDAYVFKTTIRTGEEQNVFTYNKGKFWDVPITDGTDDAPLGEAKIAGSIGTFAYDPEARTLTWTDDEKPGEVVLIKTNTSALYNEADMDAARAAIDAEFSGWEGCEMHSTRYAGDEANTAENIAWLSSLKDKSYTQVMEFLSGFHSPVEGGGAWEADTEYTDWQWWLAREDGGSWELVTWGY